MYVLKVGEKYVATDSGMGYWFPHYVDEWWRASFFTKERAEQYKREFFKRKLEIYRVDLNERKVG